MFVIVDFEWVRNMKALSHPSQLAAVSVNESWEITGQFFTRIAPKDSSFHIWKQIGYSGGSPLDFVNAPALGCAINEFLGWLLEDDVILIWGRLPQEALVRTIKYATGKRLPNPIINLSEYVKRFLNNSRYACLGVESIASKHNVPISKPLHHSLHDAEALAAIMREIRIPQSLFDASSDSIPLNPHLFDAKYCHEPERNLFHKTTCDKIVSYNHLKPFEHISTAFEQNINPCTCTKNDYLHENLLRKKKRLESLKFVYLYSQKSDVFHRFNCSLACFVSDPYGSVTYEKASEDRRPCKRCNPQPSDIFDPNAPQSPSLLAHISRKERDQKPAQYRKDIENAIKRYHEAKKLREAINADQSLTPMEKHDKYVLSTPVFSVIAARGYSNYHRAGCTRLKGLSSLKGYESCHKANAAGLTPCKYCKPNIKSDVKLSIPLSSKPNPTETIDDLISLCESSGLDFSLDGSVVNLSTPVGKWQILTQTSPVMINHINLQSTPYNSDEYHVQPRIFFSMSDALTYIKQHDLVK